MNRMIKTTLGTLFFATLGLAAPVGRAHVPVFVVTPETSTIKFYVRASVVVQPEMEEQRFPFVSIPSLGRGFSRHRYNHQAIPQHGCVPAEPASVSPGQIIVAPPRPSVSTSGWPVILNFLRFTLFMVTSAS
jgi:hypothetical protein